MLAAGPVFLFMLEEGGVDYQRGQRIAEGGKGITVFTSHLADGHLVAINRHGRVMYHNDSHDGYFDVDPSPEGEMSVLYAAYDEFHDPSRCQPIGRDRHCHRLSIERLNLTTNETTLLYSRVTPRSLNSEIHDVDRLSRTSFVVADMENDEVFIFNSTTGNVRWKWSLQQYLPLSTGGEFPSDWAHLNDVETLDDGRIMVSLRNQDQVVFVDREHGVIDSLTLGSDGDHATLFEQHNPDYIPANHGGPAVLVADSENNRIVEYHRTASGEWAMDWSWSDGRLQWPRDADRLPDGHTLITDSAGGRLLEVNESGAIVWRASVPNAYEAERLGTGDESDGGSSAISLRLQSRTAVEKDKGGVGNLIPAKIRNGITNGMPPGIGFFEFVPLVLAGIIAVIWLGIELYWAGVRVRIPITMDG